MASSSAPSKSRLHNFELPLLKWNTGAKSSAHPKRPRSIISPTRRPNPSSLSPLIDSPMRNSVSATPQHRQSPLPDSPHLQSPLPDSVSAAAPRRRSPLLENSAASRESSDYSVKQSPFRGESSSKRTKKSPIGGDVAKRSPVPFDWTRKSQIGGELVNRSPVGGKRVESSKRSKGASIEHPKNHSKSPGPKIGGSNSESGIEKLEKKSKTVEVKKSKTKFLIKLSCKKPAENLQEEPAKVEPIAEVKKADEVQEEVKIKEQEEVKIKEDDNNNNKNNNNNDDNMSIDEETKIWNLRPRKPKRKSLNANGGAAQKGESSMPEKNKAQSSPSKNVKSKSGGKEVCVGGSSTGGGGAGEKKKEKKKLAINISLTKEEIEADIFALTGSKPRRRPKKRAKNIQKQLDYVFPGLWLQSVTPETYKVSEN